ncbi:hypothetical protein [Peribacillus asahii]|uniref:hypothetical protein n=1 Tax=Peribacillus asahii TaxID=228899 RepID=UPI0020793B23|nr:hypothetical protein [Peribacillus asahii]USK69197.1 hypothetical protein LIS76_16735 [Peribacillus asahii]
MLLNVLNQNVQGNQVPTKKSRIYVSAKYSCVPVNQSSVEYTTDILDRESAQLFYTKSKQALVFNILHREDIEVDLQTDLLFFSEYGYFEVDSNEEKEAVCGFNYQLNESTVDNTYILLYDFQNKPYLLAPILIQFDVDGFERYDEIGSL